MDGQAVLECAAVVGLFLALSLQGRTYSDAIARLRKSDQELTRTWLASPRRRRYRTAGRKRSGRKGRALAGMVIVMAGPYLSPVVKSG